MVEKKFLAIASLAISLLIVASPAFAYSLDVKLISQDPIPAQRGEAVDLFFKADITDAKDPPKNLVFKIFPDYPFTVVSSPTIDFGDMTNFPHDEAITFKFRVLVDKNSDKGDSEIEVGYSFSDQQNFITNKYNVSVEETRTDFEVVVQDIQGNDVSLGIANTGKSSASSVTVRIPEQDEFDVSGVSSNVIGDLDRGDFTIVTFKVNPKFENERNLKVGISYTDLIGNRYTLQKEVPLEIIPETDEQIAANKNPISENIFIIVGIVIVAIIAFLVYRRAKRKRK